MKTIDNGALMKVFRALLKELKQKTEERVYPIFPPEKIEILGSGKILYEAKNGVTDLRECLRQLGVTMYHLASGESEYNKTSYQIDGYLNRPLDSELWPILALLLSGKAFSIPQIEDAISRKKKVMEYLRTAANGAGALTRQNFINPARKLILMLGAIPGKTAAAAQRNWSWILKPSASILAVASLFEIVWYWVFNWPFSNAGGILFYTFLFIGGFIVIAVTTFDNDVNESIRNVMIYLCLPLMIIAMLAYATTSFIAFVPAKDGKTPIENYSVLIDRKTGDFMGRLPLSEGDARFVWKKQPEIWHINHLKYKVVPGIPLEDYVEATYEFEDGARTYELPAKIYYKIKAERREEYVKAWKKWKNAKNLKSALLSEISNKTVPIMNNRFPEILESLDKTKTADLLFNKSLIDQRKEELDNLIIQAFRTELSKLKEVRGQEVKFLVTKWTPYPPSKLNSGKNNTIKAFSQN